MTFNDSVDGQLMEIVKDGVLQEEYNFENSKDPIPNPEEGGPTT
ncbi:MAG: hypothetical protein Q4F54_00285 [Coriobacteriia bacterium]|nr:hypothetical protein [Coriobacteriia bacterium]